jgi:hypothetical protein
VRVGLGGGSVDGLAGSIHQGIEKGFWIYPLSFSSSVKKIKSGKMFRRLRKYEKLLGGSLDHLEKL